MKRKIIFLDFDGVLNSKDNEDAICCAWKDGDGKSKDAYGYLFDQRCVNWLNHIHHVTGCCYVISSSWRSAGLADLINMFIQRNINGSIIGITPSNEFNHLRGMDIEEWIAENGMEGDVYCIIDDHNDFLEHQAQWHVMPDTKYGLTKYHSQTAIGILNRL